MEFWFFPPARVDFSLGDELGARSALRLILSHPCLIPQKILAACCGASSRLHFLITRDPRGPLARLRCCGCRFRFRYRPFLSGGMACLCRVTWRSGHRTRALKFEADISASIVLARFCPALISCLGARFARHASVLRTWSCARWFFGPERFARLTQYLLPCVGLLLSRTFRCFGPGRFRSALPSTFLVLLDFVLHDLLWRFGLRRGTFWCFGPGRLARLYPAPFVSRASLPTTHTLCFRLGGACACQFPHTLVFRIRRL